MGKYSIAVRWAALLCILLICILGPYFAFGEAIGARSLTLLNDAGFWGKAMLVAALLAADVFLPVPSSIVSTIGGTYLGVVGGTISSTAGMTVGALLGYMSGRVFGNSLVPRLLTPESQEQAELLTARRGLWAVAAARPVPVLAEASVIMAGVNRMPLLPFMVIASLSNLGVSLVYATAGAYSSGSSFGWALAAAIVLPGVALAVSRATARRRERAAS